METSTNWTRAAGRVADLLNELPVGERLRPVERVRLFLVSRRGQRGDGERGDVLLVHGRALLKPVSRPAVARRTCPGKAGNHGETGNHGQSATAV